jgi:hypothetical protein
MTTGTYDHFATGSRGQLLPLSVLGKSTTCIDVREHVGMRCERLERSLRMSRQAALQGFPYWTKIQLVKMRRHPDNRARSLQPHALSAPQTGNVPPHRERSSLEAFAFSGPGDHVDAMQRACIGSPTQRPAPTTNRTCRPGVGKATRHRSMRDGVTGSACSESNCPTVALGLELHRSGHPDGEGDFPYHPAAALTAARLQSGMASHLKER